MNKRTSVERDEGRPVENLQECASRSRTGQSNEKEIENTTITTTATTKGRLNLQSQFSTNLYLVRNLNSKLRRRKKMKKQLLESSNPRMPEP